MYAVDGRGAVAAMVDMDVAVATNAGDGPGVIGCVMRYVVALGPVAEAGVPGRYRWSCQTSGGWVGGEGIGIWEELTLKECRSSRCVGQCL